MVSAPGAQVAQLPRTSRAMLSGVAGLSALTIFGVIKKISDPNLQNYQSCCVSESRGVREITIASRVVVVATWQCSAAQLPRPRAMGAAEVLWGRHGVRHRGPGSWSQPSLRVPIPAIAHCQYGMPGHCASPLCALAPPPARARGKKSQRKRETHVEFRDIVAQTTNSRNPTTR